MARGPLALFRKHQKKLLAFFGVAIMIAFLLPSASVKFFQGSRNETPQNQIVVQWKGDTLSENELFSLRAEHAALMRFLHGIIRVTEERGGNPQAAGLVRVPSQQRDENGQPVSVVRDPGISSDNSDAALVQTILLSQEAKRQGLIVHDKTIQQFLRQLMDGMGLQKEMEQIAQEALNIGMDDVRLFAALRRYLMAQKMLLLASSGGSLATPGQNWEYFNRLYRNITAEILPLPVSDFVSEVPDPTEVQLKNYFEKHKNQIDNPNDPNPGFKRPARVSLESLAADMGQFRAEAEQQVTEEEIQTYYDNNLDEFKRKEPPPEPASEDAPNDEDVPNDDASQTDQQETGNSAEPDISAEAQPEPTEAEAAADDPRQVLPNPPAPETSDASDPRQAVPQPPVPSGNTLGISDGNETYRDVSIRQAANHDSLAIVRGQNPEEETVSEQSDQEEAADPTELDESDLNFDLESAETDDGDQTDNLPSETDIESEFKINTEHLADPDPDYGYYELDEVADQIRERLAIPVAHGNVLEIIKQARTVLHKYFENHRLWLANEAQGLETPEPERPDFQQLADEHGLTAGNIPQVSRRELVTSHEIGFAQVMLAGGNPASLGQILFGTNLLDFMPTQALLFDPNTQTEKLYLLWKTSSEEESVPELEDVRDDVVTAWKMKQAVAIAEEKVREIADDVNQEGKNLSAVDPEKTNLFGPFSWLTLTASPENPMGQIVLTQVDGVERIGHDFMQAVFSLSVGQAGPAINHTQEVVYAIKVLSEETDEETRRQNFFDNLDQRGGFDPQLLRIARIEQQQLLQKWYEKLENDLEVVWNRPPAAASFTR